VTFHPQITIPITERKPEEKQTLRYFEAFSSGISPKPLLQETISGFEILQSQIRSAQFDTVTLFSPS